MSADAKSLFNHYLVREGNMEKLSEAKDASGSKDDLVDYVYLSLKDSAYPKKCSASLKRHIRLRSKKFEVRNGELYYKLALGEGNVSYYKRCNFFFYC